jgi:3-methyladenine DNA glycosylase AlkD
VDWARVEQRVLLRELRRRARPELSEALRAYLGSPLPTLAVSAPELHRVVGGFRRRNGPQSSVTLQPLLRVLWSGRTYEERVVAIEILDRYVEAQDDSSWQLADSWAEGATGWGLCDALASGPIARMVAAEPQRFSGLTRWTRAPDLWRRRASVYALHDMVFAGDLDRPFALLARLARDSEFWVQRAVGTWLRECWKKDSHRTERFLWEHVHDLAPLTITIATERAPKSLRVALRGSKMPRPKGTVRDHAHIRRSE